MEFIFQILLHFEYFDYLVAGAGLLDNGPEGAGGGGGEDGGAAGLQALPALAADSPGGGGQGDGCGLHLLCRGEKVVDLLADRLAAGAVEHSGEALVVSHLGAEERELEVSVQ